MHRVPCTNRWVDGQTDRQDIHPVRSGPDGWTDRQTRLLKKKLIQSGPAQMGGRTERQTFNLKTKAQIHMHEHTLRAQVFYHQSCAETVCSTA